MKLRLSFIREVNLSHRSPWAALFSPSWRFLLFGGNNTVIYSSARERPGYMNEAELCDTLSVQSENGSGRTNGLIKNTGFYSSVATEQRCRVHHQTIALTWSRTISLTAFHTVFFFSVSQLCFIFLFTPLAYWLSGSPTEFHPVTDCEQRTKDVLIYKAIILN